MNTQIPQPILAEKKRKLFRAIVFQHLTSIINLWGNLDKYESDCHALTNFRKTGGKNISIEDYAKKRTRFNQLGIPCAFFKEICGYYRDENKVNHRIPYRQIIEELVKEGKVLVYGAGTVGMNRKHHITKKYLLTSKLLRYFFDPENEQRLHNATNLDSFDSQTRAAILKHILKPKASTTDYLRAKRPTEENGKLLNEKKLQEFVDKQYLSEKEAQRIATSISWMDRSVRFKPHSLGFSDEDRIRQAAHRANLYNHLVTFAEDYGLHEDDIKRFQEARQFAIEHMKRHLETSNTEQEGQK